MFVKSHSCLLALACILPQITAQEFKDINIYSTPDCGADPNNPETLSRTLSLSPRNGDPQKVSSDCFKSSLSLDGWPTSEAGKYDIWVNPNNFDNGCSLLLYQLDTRDELKPDAACKSVYRQISKEMSSCAQTRVTETFGVTYCCGGDCDKPMEEWKRDDSAGDTGPAGIAQAPKVRDVTEIKRAAPFSSASKRGSCKFVKDGKTAQTFGPQKRMSENLPCPPDETTCGSDYTWTTGTSITDSYNVQVSVSAEFFEVVSVELSAGYEHSVTTENTYSASRHLGIEQGHTGYITFRPLYVCAKGHTEGDCSGEKVEPLTDAYWCVAKLLADGHVDGDWEIVIID